MRREPARLAVAGAFAALFAVVMLAEYAIFRRALEALAALQPAGPPLTLYFLESFLVLVLIVMTVSFVAGGLWSFYRASDTRLLLAAPIPLGGLYALRSAQTFLQTSWALVVLGAPALLALGTTYRRPAAFYAGAMGILGLFAALAGSLGTLLTALAGALFHRVGTRLGIGATILVLLAVFAVLVGRNVIPSTADFFAVFEPGMANGKPASIKFIERKFGLWPSHPFAAELYAQATGGRAGSTASRALLWLGPLLALVAAATLGRRLFARVLPTTAEGFVLASAGRATTRAPEFPRHGRGAVGALVERDLLAIVRSPSELGRAGFLAFLLVLYTSFIFVAPVRDAGSRPDVLARLLLLDVAAAGYFLTAFGLRFVFPSMSLEGRAAWVFFSSPVRIFRVFLAKLVLYVGLLTVVVVPLAMAGALRIVRDPSLAALTGLLLLMLTVTATSVCLGFGAAWPNFREPNPEVLATSGGGLVATITCLVYVALVAWIARNAVLAAAGGGSVLVSLALGGAVSAGAIATSVVLAYRRIRRLEAV